MADIFSEPVYRDLEKLNFSVNESKVYLTLIRIGQSYAGRIAKEAKLDRSSTYNALKMLVERGIVSTVHENKRTIFVPADPKKIIDYYKEKEEIAARIIPALKAQYGASKTVKDITLFRGYKGLKTVFNDILNSTKPGEHYYLMGSEGQFKEKMPYFSPIFVKRKDELGIKTRTLIREGRTGLSRTKGSEYRAVPNDVVSPATINIYDGKVAIFIWEDEAQAVLIENAKVAETLKNWFEFIWKHAKRV